MTWVFKYIETYKINNDILPKENRKAYWALSITMQNELIDYWKIKRLPEFEKGKTQYKVRKNARLIHGHYTDEIAILIDHINTIGEYSFGADFFKIDKLKEKMYKTQVKALNEYKELYINPAGGYQYETNSHKIQCLDEICKNILEFPITKDNIRIIKWPGGKHYYIKINNEDVIIENRQKWNTRKEAEEALNLYVHKLKCNDKMFKKAHQGK